MDITNAHFLFSESKEQPVVVVDFDGVISKYEEGNYEFDKFGDPMENVSNAIQEIRSKGYKVIIWTCRPDTPALREYLKNNNIIVDDVNTLKYNLPNMSLKPFASYYIDDRAIHFDSWQNVINKIPKAEASNHQFIISTPIPHIPIDEDIDIWNKAYEITKNTSSKEEDSQEFIKEVLEVFKKMGGIDKSVNWNKPPSFFSTIISVLIANKQYIEARDILTDNDSVTASMDEGEVCLVVSVPMELQSKIKRIQDSIPKEMLIGDGIETDIHITLLYGTNFMQLMRKYGKGIPIVAQAKSRNIIEYFDNEKETVAIIRVDSEGLDEIHAELKSTVSNKDKYDDYKQHITIAYLKPGSRLPVQELLCYNWNINKIEMSVEGRMRKATIGII